MAKYNLFVYILFVLTITTLTNADKPNKYSAEANQAYKKNHKNQPHHERSPTSFDGKDPHRERSPTSFDRSDENYKKHKKDYHHERSPTSFDRNDSANNYNKQYKKDNRHHERSPTSFDNDKHDRRRERSETSFDNVPMIEKYQPDFRDIQKPFRMAKLNLIWSKAQQRLTEPKLKSLFTDLKIQDKEELAWKQLNIDNKDKDGLKEAALRKKLIGIMSTFGLLEHFDETQNPENYKHHKDYAGAPPASAAGDGDEKYRNKSLFKDKKLNKLWEKAEVSGFTPDELTALKEEFQHHQEKVDVYYNLIDTVSQGKKDHHENAVNEDELDRYNEINNVEPNAAADKSTVADTKPNVKHNQYLHDANLLREKHRDIRDNYDRLERMAAKGPNSQDFIEPKVQSLWRIAAASNFTVDDLASLKVELHHYESRLLKLRYLHAEQALNHEKYKNFDGKSDKVQHLDEHIKKQSRKLEQLQENIEQRIFRHSEL